MRRARVLIIENITAIRLSMATTLRQAGYEVDVAFNGQEAMARIKPFRPHCLIVEMFLPDISGYALCRQVRQNLPELMVGIILISESDTPLDVIYGLRQGADRYLTKPLNENTLLQNVWELLPMPLRGNIPAPASIITAEQNMLPPLFELIPRRVVNQEVMRTSTPFSRSFHIKDERARRLYNAIDGKQTVLALVGLTGLEKKEMLNALDLLLRAAAVQMYDSTGQLVDVAHLLPSL